MDEYPPDTPNDPPNPPPPSYADEPAEHAGAAPALAPLPFEDPSVPGFTGLIQTVSLFTRKPHEAFERMRTSGDFLRPVVYGLVLASLGTLVGIALNIFVDQLTSWLPTSAEYEAAKLPTGLWLVYALMSPLFVAFGLLIRAAVLHVCLMIVGGASRGFGVTVRALCYAQTFAIAMLVPICGWFAAGFWALFLEIVGLKIAQRTTYGKSVAAVLIPVVLLCTCLAILFSMFGAAIMAGMKNLPQ